MDYNEQELMEIVVTIAKEYTGYESTSVSYENAKRLMEGIIYSLNEYNVNSKSGLSDINISLKEQYYAGQQLIIDKTVRANKIYNDISQYFDGYDVLCLSDTFQKGMPEFFKWYDARFFPQDTILTLDYPILLNLEKINGVDAIYKYLKAIEIEQNFLKKPGRNYVTDILKKANWDYKNMIENICEIVMLNLLGHVIIEKPIQELEFSQSDYDKIIKEFAEKDEKNSKEIIKVALNMVIKLVYDNDEKMLNYFENDMENMTVRIRNAVETGCLEKIFVL